MTMQREYRNGPFVISCDECLETEELHGCEFDEALQDAKSRGFVVRKGDGLLNRGTGNWLHFCSECS